MKQTSTALRFLLISVLAACVLGWACFYALRSLNETSTNEMRRHMISYIVRMVENGPYNQTVDDFHHERELHEQHEQREHGELGSAYGRHGPGENLWVLDAEGKVLASNLGTPAPVLWHQIEKPKNIHDFTFHYGFLKFVPDVTLVKLDSKDNVYLLIELRKPISNRGVLWVQLTFLLLVLGAAILISVFLIYYYLKGKSKEAREVLSRLEKGDLKARFEIKRIDEIGSIMIDFNRMAAEIERLVYRVQETEKARTHLLEELGHDIRTPLTSLRTSVETLSAHLDDMPKEEQREFISVIRAELSYFIPLIEGLFFIARLAEPRYKKTTEKVDLAGLIHDEIKSRQSQSVQLNWLSNLNEIEDDETWVLGDILLMQRMIKNALDNASKTAFSFVSIHLEPKKDSVTIVIEDDGVGISDAAIANFGQRKKQRPPLNASEKDVSLGLGSVIIKTILDLHRGTFKVERRESKRGTRLTLNIPRE